MNRVESIKKRRYKIINRDGKSNFHSHTFYCDGNNSPKEMVARAIELDFRSLGFSGHQYSEPDAYYAMNGEQEESYRRDIEALQAEYRDKLNIYMGLERDYCSPVTEGYQFIIGSTHHVMMNDGWIDIDVSPEVMTEGVDRYFDGDYMAYAEAYYDQEAKVLEQTKGQIVGHFDLISKFNGDSQYFDEEDRAYQQMAINAADMIVDSFATENAANSLPKGFPEELGEIIVATGMPIFEINMGAMVNGRRKIPYPAPFIIEHLADIGVPLLLSSDCHDRNFLDFGFKDFAVNYDM